MREIDNVINVNKIQKYKKNIFISKFLMYGLSVFILFIMLVLLVIEYTLNISSLAFTIANLNLLGIYLRAKSKKKLSESLNYFNDLERKLASNDIYVDIDYKNIEIIPKNIKVGEDLSSKNIVPIFVEGNYVLIKDENEVVITRQYEVDGLKTSQILYDPLDEDIIASELPEYYDGTLKLLLKKRNGTEL